jgi:ATP-dependent DNA helicase 2 subunit 1
MSEDWETNLLENLEEIGAADEEDFRSYKDALVYAIQVSDSMLEPCGSTGDKNAVQLALEAAYESITARIIASPLDSSGIVLFGTKMSNKEEYKNCMVVMDLGTPDAKALKSIKRLIEGG